MRKPRLFQHANGQTWILSYFRRRTGPFFEFFNGRGAWDEAVAFMKQQNIGGQPR